MQPVAELMPDPSPDPEEALLTALLGLGRRLRQRLPGDEIDPSLIGALRLLAESPAVRPSALAERLQVDASTVSRQIRALEVAGLAQAGSDADDGRARLVAITDEGRATAAALLARRHALLAEVLAHWPAQDRQLLGALLARFNSDLESVQEDA